MLKKYFHVALIFGVITLLASCAKTGPTGPAGVAGPAGANGAPGPSYSGAISGHVILVDKYGTRVLTGLSSVAISINGGAPIYADANGYYIDSAKTGDYYIDATNAGYGATRINKFQYLSDTLNRDVRLSAIPDFAPATISVVENSGTANPGDSVVLTFTADSRTRNFIVFVNSSSPVSNLPGNYLLVYTKTITPNQTRVAIFIPEQDFYDVGIASKATAYFAAYGYVINDVSVYEDFVTGRDVYNAISAASQTSSSSVP